MHVLGERGADDLLGREPDALVDHLEAGVAGADRDLFGAVRVTVQTRLAHQQAQPSASEVFGRSGHGGPYGGERCACFGGDRDRRAAHPGGGTEFAEDVAQRPGPFACGDTCSGTRHGRLQEVAVARRSHLQSGQRLLGGAFHTVVAPGVQRGDHPGLVGRVDGHDCRVQVSGQRVGLGRLVAVDADDLLVAGLDPGPARRRAKRPARDLR